MKRNALGKTVQIRCGPRRCNPDIFCNMPLKFFFGKVQKMDEGKPEDRSHTYRKIFRWKQRFFVLPSCMLLKVIQVFFLRGSQILFVG